MRANLPANMRFDLEYRDAITIAFFAAYMLPQMNGLLVGFGSGNIFRRLNREAPIGAIRRSIRDTMSARSHGMRASGLEDYFADLMREAHALDTDQGLEAVHGAEPLRLYTSSYSGCYFFAWDSSLPFSAVLCALNIEGNLNRFAAVSSQFFLIKTSFLYWVCEKIVCFVTFIIAQIPEKWEIFLYYFFTRQNC